MPAQVTLMEEVILRKVMGKGSPVDELLGETDMRCVGVGQHIDPSQLNDSTDSQKGPMIAHKFEPIVSEDDKHDAVSEVIHESDADSPMKTVIKEEETPPKRDAENGLKPNWEPNANEFPFLRNNRNAAVPLLKAKLSEDKNDGQNCSYIIPSVSSSLKSYRQTWNKLKSQSKDAGSDLDRRVYDDFRRAVSSNKVDIAVDTSITGRYLKKKYVPFGFQPSSKEACEQENYKIIKLSNTDTTPTAKSDLTTSISPLFYYQSWDPVTMRYEPKLKSSEERAELVKSFPLGAAAASSRAALLSFMGSRPTIEGSSPTSMADSGLPLDSNRPFLRLSEVDINGRSNSAVQSRAQTPTATNVPENIIIPPQDNDTDSAQRIVPSEHGGGKKIEKFKKRLERKDDISPKRQREDDESFTDSSSRLTRLSGDTDDAISSKSSLRRTKRQRTSRKMFIS